MTTRDSVDELVRRAVHRAAQSPLYSAVMAATCAPFQSEQQQQQHQRRQNRSSADAEGICGIFRMDGSVVADVKGARRRFLSYWAPAAAAAAAPGTATPTASRKSRSLFPFRSAAESPSTCAAAASSPSSSLPPPSPHVLLVGGSGHLGKHLLERLGRLDASVTVFARRLPPATRDELTSIFRGALSQRRMAAAGMRPLQSSGAGAVSRRDASAAAVPTLRFIEGDVGDPAAVARAFGGHNEKGASGREGNGDERSLGGVDCPAATDDIGDGGGGGGCHARMALPPPDVVFYCVKPDGATPLSQNNCKHTLVRGFAHVREYCALIDAQLCFFSHTHATRSWTSPVRILGTFVPQFRWMHWLQRQERSLLNDDGTAAALGGGGGGGGGGAEGWWRGCGVRWCVVRTPGFTALSKSPHWNIAKNNNVADRVAVVHHAQGMPVEYNEFATLVLRGVGLAKAFADGARIDIAKHKDRGMLLRDMSAIDAALHRVRCEEE